MLLTLIDDRDAVDDKREGERGELQLRVDGRVCEPGQIVVLDEDAQRVRVLRPGRERVKRRSAREERERERGRREDVRADSR